MAVVEIPKANFVLISTESQLPLLIREELGSTPISVAGASIIDIGAGTGRFAKYAREYFPNSNVISVEGDSLLSRDMRFDMPGARIVQADALHLPFAGGVDLAVAINVTHEACEGVASDERLSKFRQFTEGVETALNPGGEFLYWEGMMPEDENQLTHITPKTDYATNLLYRFQDEYSAKSVNIHQIKPNKYELTLADLTVFVTKFRCIHLFPQYWETERQQFYPFLALRQITKTLEGVGLKPVVVSFPDAKINTRMGIKEVLEHYDIDEYTQETFPAVQVMIKAKKS